MFASRRIGGALLLAAGLTFCALARGAAAAAAAAPRVFLMDPERLAAVRARVAAGDKTLALALAKLRQDADEALQQKPVSVMDKAVAPPSGDKHDYLSQGIYWWPDPAKPDGLPYINRDGQINPESKKITDERNLVLLRRTVPTLAQAFYFTAEEKYAAHAALLLRTWFLDPATRMNPHLKYAQFIPGRNQGRYSGIVDTESLIGLPDAIGLLAGYKGWTTDDQKGVEKWLGAYCDWLVTSDFGKKESAEKNNHGTVYDAQVVSLALFSGKTVLARTVLEEAKGKRIVALVGPNGSQPSELRRTKAWSYSMKNLMNLFWLAAMGERAGVDLWNYQSADGRSIRKALDFLVPFAAGEKKWPYQELTSKTDWKPTGLGSFLRQAALVYNEPRYAALLRQHPDLAADRNGLFWPLGSASGVKTGRR